MGQETYTEEQFNEMKRAVCLLLDNAVYDVERDDECFNAVHFARKVISKYPNAKTVAAMKECK